MVYIGKCRKGSCLFAVSVLWQRGNPGNVKKATIKIRIISLLPNSKHHIGICENGGKGKELSRKREFRLENSIVGLYFVLMKLPCFTSSWSVHGTSGKIANSIKRGASTIKLSCKTPHSFAANINTNTKTNNNTNTIKSTKQLKQAFQKF